jgi:nucleotide-binding universal stress UspA family protein
VGKPAEEILQVAGDEGVDLIIIGTHGRMGLHHILLGSVAETMVRTTPCPVFTVKASVQSAS